MCSKAGRIIDSMSSCSVHEGEPVNFCTAHLAIYLYLLVREYIVYSVRTRVSACNVNPTHVYFISCCFPPFHFFFMHRRFNHQFHLEK